MKMDAKKIALNKSHALSQGPRRIMGCLASAAAQSSQLDWVGPNSAAEGT